MNDRHTTAKDRRNLGCEVEYLGDGVYVAHDGFGMWLTAEDGVVATDAIYLEPNVWGMLKQFEKRMHEPQKTKGEKHDQTEQSENRADPAQAEN